MQCPHYNFTYLTSRMYVTRPYEAGLLLFNPSALWRKKQGKIRLANAKLRGVHTIRQKFAFSRYIPASYKAVTADLGA